jgi:hypothetical protein
MPAKRIVHQLVIRFVFRWRKSPDRIRPIGSKGKLLMKRALIVLATAATLGASLAPQAATAGGGEVAAGVIGGLAVGAIIGSAAAAQPRYYEPAPVYVAPPPRRRVYFAPPPVECYWARGEPEWDGYRWRRPRVQVCD